MLPLAPGRFSTMTCWPSRAASGSAMTRALLSARPPGANGTTMRTGRAGNCCPAAHSCPTSPQTTPRSIPAISSDLSTTPSGTARVPLLLRHPELGEKRARVGIVALEELARLGAGQEVTRPHVGFHLFLPLFD